MPQAMMSIKSPATGETLGGVPILGEGEVRSAVESARRAYESWRKTSFAERKQLFMKARRVIFDQLDDLANLISRENGKPVIEAISHDILPVMDLITYFAKKTEKLLRKEKIRLGKWGALGHSSTIEYDPYGVVGIISPWNFPFSIPMGGVVMALVTGNGVVLKPSEYTSLIGLRIGEIFREAGLPEGVLQIVTGDGSTGASLIHSGVDKICFTGSVPTGKRIMAEAAKHLLPVTLELGGKDPFIVLPDANLDMASSAAVWGAFCNSGQVCASIERVYVPEALVERFTKLVVEKTKKLRQGVGTGSDVDVGSMTAEMQIRKVEAHVEDALKRGAKILAGGKRRTDLPGFFFEPTVLSGVDHSFPVVFEETFGPVLPIMTYKTEAEAVSMANDSPYALNAYIWAGDLEKGKKVASEIVAGTVNVNESVFTYALPQTPWGGPKESGVGRTHGAMGLLEMVRVRHIHVNKRASKFNNFWWFGYSAEKLDMIKALCAILFGRLSERLSGILRFVRLARKVKTL